MKLRNIIKAFVAALLLFFVILMLSGIVQAAPYEKAEILQRVNALRTKHDVPVLTFQDQLQRSAQAKAEHMCAEGYFEHSTPDGQRFHSFITREGYRYENAAENLARGYDSTDDLIQGWVMSDSHYKTMLDPDYTETGIGIKECGNRIIVVQHFGLPEQKESPDTPVLVTAAGILAGLATLFYLGVRSNRKKSGSGNSRD